MAKTLDVSKNEAPYGVVVDGNGDSLWYHDNKKEKYDNKDEIDLLQSELYKEEKRRDKRVKIKE